MDSDDEDVTIVKVTTTKKPMKAASWVTSSFGDFGPMSMTTTQCVTKNVSQSQSAKSRPQLKSSSSQDQPPRQSTIQTKLTGLVPSSNSFTVPSSSKAAPSTSTRKRPHGISDLPAHRLTSLVKSDSQRHRFKSAVSSELWSDKYQPKKKDDLAVHKKKVEDITNWLRERTKHFKKHAAPILLLTGGPGAGKTATVKAVASELKLEIQEWSNPDRAGGDSDFSSMDREDFFERSSVDVYSSQSQASQFSLFLLRANKYQALQLNFTEGTATSPTNSAARGKFILVEDIPNAFYRDPSELHSILRKYRYSGHCPLVFIVSDASNSSSNVQRLFPPDVQEELHLESISVNPVAPTMMVKVLNRIASQEANQGHFATPSARVVESIAMSSAGDVRSAINALQFACRQDTVDLSKLRTAEKCLKKAGSGSGRRLKYGSLARHDSGISDATQREAVIGAKDTTCFLFHALGKILHFKRGDPADNPSHPRLPAHLSQHERDPLLLTPEEIVEKTHLGGDYFNTFLHQNYVDFMSSVEEIDRASEYLSTADILSAQYTSRGQLQDYSVSVATRGVIHSDSSMRRHTDSRTGHGWRPLHKSPWFSTLKQCQQSQSTAMRLFRGYHWDPEILLTELVPYINLINPILHDPGQIAFVQNLCHFSKSRNLRPNLEKLDEKEAANDDADVEESQVESKTFFRPSTTQPSASFAGKDNDDDDNLPSSQSAVKNAPVEADDDEDMVIEDFDD